MDLRNLSEDELRVECDKQMAECLEEQRRQGVLKHLADERDKLCLGAPLREDPPTS